jgi:hypothetical protein
MKSKKRVDRKTTIEIILKQAYKISGDQHEREQAWLRLIRELEGMCHPEARMPRFAGLTHSLWIAVSNDQT